MNCPNDRYVNDSSICQAVTAMLAQIGIKVNLMAETKVTYFPKILSRNTSVLHAGMDAGLVRCPERALRPDHDSVTGRAGAFQPGDLFQQARR